MALSNALQNENQLTGSVRTNGAMERQVNLFLDRYQHEIRNIFSGNPQNLNQRLNDLARQYFLEGFSNDTVTNAWPISAQFVERALQNVDFYFGLDPQATGNGGMEIHNNRIVNLNSLAHTGHAAWDRDRNLEIIVDEFAHSLGAGESLSALIQTRFLPNTTLNWASDPTHIARNATFQESFLSHMERNNRGDEFWNAMQLGDAAFKNLWDMEMGHLASSNVVFGAKAADLWAKWDSQVGVNLQGAIGMSRENASQQLIRDWNIATGSGPQSQRDAALANFNNLASRMAQFANQRGMDYRAVYDDVLGIHHASMQIQDNTLNFNAVQPIQVPVPVPVAIPVPAPAPVSEPVRYEISPATQPPQFQDVPVWVEPNTNRVEEQTRMQKLTTFTLTEQFTDQAARLMQDIDGPSVG